MFNFTGSAIVSIGCTVTDRSRKPLSATIRAVSNFCVLAGARTWSAFFSYNILPLFASTTITEAAVVFGIPSGVYSVAAGADSSVSFDFVRAWRERACVDFDAFAFGAEDSVSSSALSFDFFAFGAEDSVSSSALCFALTALALRTGPATPLGRNAWESAAS